MRDKMARQAIEKLAHHLGCEVFWYESLKEVSICRNYSYPDRLEMLAKALGYKFVESQTTFSCEKIQ